MTPKIEVLIATYNGGERLVATLESLTRVVEPETGWRLIVVDNASSDDTPEILDRFRERLPLRVLREERRGKNVALNSAIPALTADLVAFTDDDVVLPADWLVRFVSASEQYPEYEIFAGRVEAKWPGGQVPVHIAEAVPMGPAFAVHPQDLPEGEIRPEYVWGPNFCVVRSLFDMGYRFNVELGPSPGIYIMGGETEFAVRLHSFGHRCRYLPDNVVRHQIREEQLTVLWLSRRARRFGRSAARRGLNEERGGAPAGAVPSFFGVPRWYFADVARQWMRLVVGALTGDQCRLLAAAWNSNYRIALIVELISLRWKIQRISKR